MYEKLNTHLTDKGIVIDPTRIANRADIVSKLKIALTENKTYLAVSAPTAAQKEAQTKELTKQNNKMIRLLVNLLDGTD